MKIDILQITPNAEQLIEKIGRICYDSSHLIKEGSHVKFISSLISRGHDSVLEHGVVTFHVSEVSRSLTHQLIRHRIGCSYTQRSQRYCKENDFDYVIPDSIIRRASIDNVGLAYNTAMNGIRECYAYLIAEGVKPEDARMLLPNACHTEITVTMNFRALRNFFKLRLDSHAQWEIRELAYKMLQLVYQHAPVVFQDLYDQFLGEKNA